MQKDKEKGKAASKYRPITYLPLVWKVLTSVTAEEIYGFLNTKMRKQNLSMAWIGYKKAYDMVPHSWIIDCLETVGINENIRRLLPESMKSWRVELTSGEENLGGFNIRRGIFQGDLLLFVVCLLPLTHILRDAYQKIILQATDKKITIYFLWMT